MTSVQGLDLRDYVCGGFVVAQPGDDIGDLHGGYLAQRGLSGPTISACGCIAECLPWDFMFSWKPEWSLEERIDAASDWGIPAAKVPDLVAWVNEREAQGQMAFSNLFLGAATAQTFVHRFLPPTCDVRVLGMALAREDVTGFRSRIAQLGDVEPKSSWCPTLDQLEHRKPMAPGGRPLGYEVLGVSTWGERHSWHCGYIARQMHKEFGVLPGAGGLFLHLEEARRVAGWSNRPDSAAELSAWAAWLLVEYELGRAPE